MAKSIDHLEHYIGSGAAESMKSGARRFAELRDQSVWSNLHRRDDDAAVASRCSPSRLVHLEDGHVDATIGQGHRRGQSGVPGSHDCDLGAVCSVQRFVGGYLGGGRIP